MKKGGRGRTTDKWLHRELTYEIIGSAIEVHRVLGGGFLEYVYEEAFCHELGLKAIPCERQVELDIHYKDHLIPKKYRADVLVDGKIIVEIKASSGLTAIDEAQLLHYMKATKHRIGLLLNFGRRRLETKRLIL